jgi:radical SAM protein with 4Fe4S-binding SPASM domain
MKFEGFPILVGWELTLSCNLRCNHCASSAGISRPDELRTDEAIDLCEQFPDLLVQEVDFTGGEPLLRSDWTQIAAKLAKLEIPTRMVTNGLLLRQNISRLLDAGVKTVAVSLDGLGDTHDRIRCHGGLFKEVTDGIEAGISAGLPIAVITAANDINIDDLPQLGSFLKDIGVVYWQVQPTFARGRAAGADGLRLSQDTFLKLGKFVRKNAELWGSNGKDIVPADGVGYFTELDGRKKAWKGCGAGLASCGITSDGKIKGCLSFPDSFVEGDLRERSMWDIWFDERSFSFNRHFTIDDLGRNCGDCEFGEQCKGGCCVMSYASTAKMHNDPYCFHGILSRNPENKEHNFSISC